MSQKDKIAEIKTKTKRCLIDKKALNAVIDILCYSQDEDLNVAMVAVRALQRIFIHFLSSDQMSITHLPDQDKDLRKEDQLAVWLQEQYHTACNAMLEKLELPGTKIQEAAMVALLKFVETEKNHPLHLDKASFPASLLQSVVSKLLLGEENMTAIIGRLSEVDWGDDITYILKAVKSCIKQVPYKERNEHLLSNALTVIENLDIPAESQATDDDSAKKNLLKEQKKIFTGCIMAVLKSELTPALYRRILKRMDEKIIPFLSSPLILADFLTQAYDVGGTISLLALNGLFILIHQHNLNYPDFYKKFYNLLDENIFIPDIQHRFFRLADIFLSSTHLPAYLVASFIKRFARLALFASPVSCCVCIAFVVNLLVRHPSCGVMIHRENCTMNCDPFLEKETDPSKTCALESMLWEIKTLQSHVNPEVVELAMKINHPVSEEIPLEDYLQSTSEMLVEKSLKKLKKEYPLSDEPPTALFSKNWVFSLA